MKNCLIVCLVSVTSLMMQGSAENRGSDKRECLSKSDLGKSTEREDVPCLSRSAPMLRTEPMLIPQKNLDYDLSPSVFYDLIGNPDDYGVRTYTATAAILTKQRDSLADRYPKYPK